MSIELHVPANDRDGSYCLRCSAILSAGGGFFIGGNLVAMPDGHYSSARTATPDDLRTGALCAVKERKPKSISLHLNCGPLTVMVDAGGTISMTRTTARGDAERWFLSTDDARALCQALRECIGPEDVAAEIAKAREQWPAAEKKLREQAGRPVYVNGHDWTGYPTEMARLRAETLNCDCAGCRAARATSR